jgi:predicted dehydrogenase
MSRIINFGIVGCGIIGNTHAQSLRALPDVAALAACCDEVPGRAEEFAAKYGGIAAYTSLDEMLAHPGLDCICVCTPSGMHAEAILAAADKGINSIVEKPMDITKEHLDAIVNAAETKGVKVGCIFQRRAWDIVNRIKDAVQGGELGKMVLGDAQMMWYRSQEYYDSGAWRGTYEMDGGGALMNQGIHGIDLLQYIMGPIHSVKAYADTLTHRIDVEDTLTAVIRYKNGALGTLVVTTCANPGYPMRHAFMGEKGTIVLEEDKLVTWNVGGEEKADAPAASGPKAAAADPSAITMDGHTRLIKDMAEAVRDDRAPMVPPELGRTAVDLVLAMYESAKTNEEVILI